MNKNQTIYFYDDLRARVTKAVEKKKALTFNAYVVEAVKEKLAKDKIK